MTENKTSFATPNSSKLAQILLQLKEIDGVGEPDVPGENTLYFSNTDVESDEVPKTTENTSQPIPVETCNCRKSKCLKLYCQCFAGKMTCNTLCRCVSCENTPDNSVIRTEAIKIILERNPNAFDSKFKPVGTMGTPAPVLTSIEAPVFAASHKNGCRCRKSFCLKKYCECFQASVTCSAICTCLSCCNTGPSSSSLDSIVIVNRQHLPLSTHKKDSLNNSNSGGVQQIQQVVIKKESGQSLVFDSHLQELSSPPPVLTSRNSSSLDGFLTHMMDNFEREAGGPSFGAHRGAPVKVENGASSAFNSTRPPLGPSSAKRKREEGDEHSEALRGNPSTPNQNASLPSEDEKRQATNLLERQLFSDFGSGVLAGMFPSNDQVQGGGGMSTAPRQSINMRSASPNSMSIATALSLFAANCFHHYNSSLSLPVASPSSSSSSSSSSMGISIAGGAQTSAGDVVISEVLHLTPVDDHIGRERMRGCIGMGLSAGGHCSDTLDTSTTSEDTDEDPHENNGSSRGFLRGSAAADEELGSSQQSVLSSIESSQPDENGRYHAFI